MGNFGKRILIVCLSVALVVALAIVGNTYQQRSKEHNIKNASAVVYSGKYQDIDYSVTKSDVWKNILYSSPMSTVDELIDKYLLSEAIDAVKDETEIKNKINYLIYSTTDADTISDYQAETAKNQELIDSFTNKMTVLGYYKNGEAGKNWNDYAKLMIAFDNYAKYRINNGLKVGTVTPDVSDETLKAAWLKEYNDTYTLSIKFYSEADYTSFIKSYKLAVISSKFRMYIGDSDYLLNKNSDGSYYLNDDFSLPYKTQTVTYSDESTKEEKIPNGNIAYTTSTDEDGNTITTYSWDSTTNSWKYTNDATSFVPAKVEYKDATSYSTSNTAVLSQTQILSLYLRMYNDYYKQERASLVTSVSLTDFEEALASTNIVSGLMDDASVSALNSILKNYGLVVVTYTDSLNKKVQEIRKYVGDSEYVLDVDENGFAIGENGFATYKEFTYTPSSSSTATTSVKIPNYKIMVDSEGNPVLDLSNNFQYYLDQDGNRVANDSKLSISDQTSFTTQNTITASSVQLYQAYISMKKDNPTITTWSTVYNDRIANASSLLYNYDELNDARTDVAKQIFVTLTYDTATGSYMAIPTSFDGANTSETPYYLIFKLSNSTRNSDPTAEELAAYKEKKIQEYLDTKGFVTLAVAELRAEAGLTIYDEFFGYEYASIIANDSDTNPDGPAKDDYENYYKVKNYKSNKLAALTKKIDVMEVSKDKYTITPDMLYDYCLSFSASSYISTSCLNKVLLLLPAFETIHGSKTLDKYLTSKNWKMKQYASTTEQYNYYFEYYKSMYASYGYDYYDSLDEFLYSYGTRNFDDMVESLARSTMRNIFIYGELVGDLSTTTLSNYATSTTVFGSDKFKKLYDEYYDILVYHILFFVDYDEDGTPDDYDDFLKEFDETTGKHSSLKNAAGEALTLTEWNQTIDKLYALLTQYVYNDTTWSSSKISNLENFITEYNESSRIDGKYKEFKNLGIYLEYEALSSSGDTISNTDTSLDNYVDKFKTACLTILEKLERVDNDLQGYSIGDGLTETQYGLHFIVETAGTNFNKANFEYNDEKGQYAAGVSNDKETVSNTQLALYMQQYAYTQIYGDTDNPSDNAGFDYPNLPEDITTAFTDYYSTYFTNLLDESSTYHSNYIMIQYLLKDNSSYQAKFQELSDIYYSVLFGSLS